MITDTIVDSFRELVECTTIFTVKIRPIILGVFLINLVL